MATRLRASLAMAVATVALGLAGCGGTVQEKLGLEKRVPDEFQVVRQKPLTMPPDGGELPAPGTATAASLGRDPAAGAQALLGGVGRTSGVSEGERALLAAAPGEAQPGIRERIEVETRAAVESEAAATLALMPWQRRAGRGEPLAAEREAERLRSLGVRTTGPGRGLAEGS